MIARKQRRDPFDGLDRSAPPAAEQGLIHFTLAVAEESIQQKAVVYDRAGDAHYDTISAFIKSMRGSDEKGAMYWLAKMLHAGEDFRFIARRIVIFASEDVGLADAEALPLAIATQQAVEFVGMPEAQIPLAHATAYMCRAKKSREALESLVGGERTNRSRTDQARSRKPEKQTLPGKSGEVRLQSPVFGNDGSFRKARLFRRLRYLPLLGVTARG